MICRPRVVGNARRSDSTDIFSGLRCIWKSYICIVYLPTNSLAFLPPSLQNRDVPKCGRKCLRNESSLLFTLPCGNNSARTARRSRRPFFRSSQQTLVELTLSVHTTRGDVTNSPPIVFMLSPNTKGNRAISSSVATSPVMTFPTKDIERGIDQTTSRTHRFGRLNCYLFRLAQTILFFSPTRYINSCSFKTYCQSKPRAFEKSDGERERERESGVRRRED
jgi:hypothetical protein